MNGVSIIIPAYNAEGTLRECLRSVTALNRTGEIEVILVNDGSTDKTAEIGASFPGVRVIDTRHQGAARATNLGIRAARYDTVALVDADVILEKDWLEKILPCFDNASVAAAGGCLATANKTAIGKLAGYDVELRLSRASADIDHLSTANTAYRRQALLDIGLFSEDLMAGYDVDLSRRLKAAGYRLILKKDTGCRHYWKDSLGGYLRQQYNYAYYRMTLTRKFGKAHDRITTPAMILQVPFTALVLLFAALGSRLLPWAPLTLLIIPLIHLPETFLMLCQKKDPSAFLLPLLFTLRNLCWVGAAAVWGVKHLSRSVFQAAPEPESDSAPEPR